MAQKHENPSRPQELTSSEDAQETEIQPLSDEALEEAAGGSGIQELLPVRRLFRRRQLTCEHGHAARRGCHRAHGLIPRGYDMAQTHESPSHPQELTSS